MSTRQKGYTKSKQRIALTVGDSVKIARELQEMSQNDLSALTGIPQSVISGIERNRITLGVERAKKLARALHVHPAVILFPDWETEEKFAA